LVKNYLANLYVYDGPFKVIAFYSSVVFIFLAGFDPKFGNNFWGSKNFDKTENGFPDCKDPARSAPAPSGSSGGTCRCRQETSRRH
jgi:hypothetical protein